MQRVLLQFKWDMSVKLQLAMIALVDFENILSRVLPRQYTIREYGCNRRPWCLAIWNSAKLLGQCTRVDGGCVQSIYPVWPTGDICCR